MTANRKLFRELLRARSPLVENQDGVDDPRSVPEVGRLRENLVLRALRVFNTLRRIHENSGINQT